MRQVPVDARRSDWPRLVAGATNDTQARVLKAENLQGGFSRAKLSFVSG
jgi:hypothetical protein